MSPPTGRRGPIAALLLKLVVVAVSVGVPLAMAEVACRLAGYRGLEVYRPDSEVGWVLAPDQETVTSAGHLPVRISSQGFRDTLLADPRPDSLIVVAALGASTTYGWGVKLEETYHQLLERRLNDGARAAGSGVRYEVLNAGIVGYNLRQAGGLMERLIRDHAPDGFLVAYTFNDAWNRFGGLPDAERDRVLAGVRRKNVLRQSALFNWITTTVGRRAYRSAARQEGGDHPARVQTGDGPAERADLADLRATLEGMGERAGQAGASLVLLVPAARGQVEPWPRQAEMAQAGAALGVPVVDLLPVFRGLTAATAFLADDAVHPSAAGHHLVSRELLSGLCRAAAAAGAADPVAIYRPGCGIPAGPGPGR